MGSLLRQLQQKSASASQFVMKHGCAYYKQVLDQNKHYIVKEPTVEQCQELSKQLLYTRLASLPGRYESFWKEVEFLKNKIRNRQDLKLEEIGVAALFAGECYAWFCIGEIIGRGFTLTGYKV
ncbi:hypothetical protein O6H91_21G043100 [Diphasiastrum complanatum]|uniref:Uncharacterized protein n=2 Tax=Diphasiastrum complanatum TaxID=34168 RepID=A0ACC2AJU6_DIPCM|nr:hypothetical protein O6H91_21G042600 [Diphasiastrum complanatum]KAJ7517858.1 hypothetical protein O6H91_21G043100 [Diphasiastrum complanatum]